MKSVLVYFPWKDPEQSPLLRQTPGGLGCWGGYRFYLNQAPCECDYHVVYGGYRDLISPGPVPRSHTLFIGGEPPSIKKYADSYLAQFGGVICCDSELNHPNLKLFQQGYPWFVGLKFLESGREEALKNYDDYKNETQIEKSKLLSVVCSAKQSKPGHRKRFEFVQRLKEAFGDEMDWFGAGENYVADKADAIRPYKYHIAIENSAFPHYWTEKLADCYLEGAFPFYAGCPNVQEYFSPESYQMIDLDDPEGAVKVIRRAMDNEVYEKSEECLKEAKRQVLDDYNLFHLIAGYFDSVDAGEVGKDSCRKIYPEKWYRKGWLYRLMWMMGKK